LGKNQINLVYGGGDIGMVGAVSGAVLASGCKVTGIIPDHYKTLEQPQRKISELVIVESTHQRKAMMAERADAFIALPGGFGTLDELFEIITWKQAYLHNKPIIIYNAFGFWDPLLKLIDHLIENGFAPKNNRQLFHVITDLGELMPILQRTEEPVVDSNSKWGI